jgi:hypothetical protein
MAVTLNASTSSGLVLTPDTSGTVEIQSNGTTKLTVSSSGAYGQLVSDTAKSATSTSVDFTGIPSWVKRITVMFSGVSTNGASNYLIQSGSGSVENTGYLGASTTTAASASTTNFTTGFGIGNGGAATVNTINGVGTIVLMNSSTNLWAYNFVGGNSDTTRAVFSGGSKAFSGTIDRVRITTVNGTDTFDAGTINIMYEG